MYFKDINEFKAGLKSLDKNTFHFFAFAEKSKDAIDDLRKCLNELNINYIGAIFPEIIQNYKRTDIGWVSLDLNLEGNPILVRDISSPDLNMISSRLDNNEDKNLLIWADGLSSDLSQFINSLYNKIGPKTTYFGAGAGSLSLKQENCLFDKDSYYVNAAFILELKDHVSVTVEHGWRPIEKDIIVTKSSGHTIHELNWKPAIEVYKSIVEPVVNRKIDIDNFFDIAKGFPFGLVRSLDDHIVRDPIVLNEDGSLYCIGAIPRGATLSILTGNKTMICEAAGKAAQKSFQQKNHKHSFIVDCISRGIYLDKEFDDELSAIKKYDHLSESSGHGVLSIGEIAKDKSSVLQVFNKTVIVGAVG